MKRGRVQKLYNSIGQFIVLIESHIHKNIEQLKNKIDVQISQNLQKPVINYLIKEN